ncbi:MAG: OmpA family protein, partial [Gemmatimonadetes bacterium]|nr:OmpA family protein [Gemmatimonadota bacterium]
MRRAVLVLMLGLAGCGYAKQKNVDAALGQVRQEMRAGDEATTQTLSARIDQNAQRLAALEQQLQQVRTEFGGRLEQLRGEFAGMIAFDLPVHFDFAKSELRSVDQPVLDRFAAVVKQYYPGVTVTVEGFTDAAGGTAYNLRLGKLRAEAVKVYLVGRGLSDTQLRTVSYGEARNRLVPPTLTGEKPGAEANRRVTLV